MNNNKINIHESSNITTETSSSSAESKRRALPIWKPIAKLLMAGLSAGAVGNAMVASHAAAETDPGITAKAAVGTAPERTAPVETALEKARAELTRDIQLAKDGRSHTLFTTWDQMKFPDGRYGYPLVETTGTGKDTNTYCFYLPTLKMPNIKTESASSIVNEAKEVDLGKLEEPLITYPVSTEGGGFGATMVAPYTTVPNNIPGRPNPVMGAAKSVPVFITSTESN